MQAAGIFEQGGAGANAKVTGEVVDQHLGAK